MEGVFYRRLARAAVALLEAPGFVSSLTVREPTEEGLEVEDEEEGGEAVALNRAAVNHYFGREAKGSAHLGGDAGVEVAHDLDGVGAVAEVIHNPQHFVVVGGVKGLGEVN